MQTMFRRSEFPEIWMMVKVNPYVVSVAYEERTYGSRPTVSGTPKLASDHAVGEHGDLVAAMYMTNSMYDPNAKKEVT